MKRNYDLIFGLGQACGCSQTLRRAGLQLLSFPGDWLTALYGSKEYPALEHDLRNRVEMLCACDLDLLFRPEDLHSLGSVSNTGKDVYANYRTRYVFSHDFTVGADLAAELPAVVTRYRRRLNRLLELIGRSKKILAVRMDVPGGRYQTTLDDCRYARDLLHRRFPNAEFDILLLSHKEGLPFRERAFEEPEPGLFRLSFDYLRRDHSLPCQPDYKLTTPAVAELFSVKDYRTREERRKHRAAERADFLAKLRRPFDHLGKALEKLRYSRFNPLENIRARCRQRKFDQIVILGFNCETAFRFYCRWGFLDSSLFAWANTFDLAVLSDALTRLDALGTGSFTFHGPSRMWRDDASGVFFHGRMRSIHGAPAPTEAELTQDREELRSRLAHLKDKFREYAVNGKPTLFVYRLGAEGHLPGLDRRLDRLEAALTGLGAKNWKLLVVCERKILATMPAGENRVFRAVTRFNSFEDVTNRRTGDPAGWNRIFTEFAPKTIKTKTHSFKFEDE